MEQLPLDFSQPANRLTAIAEIERKKNLVKNDFTHKGMNIHQQILMLLEMVMQLVEVLVLS